jgi:CubicO group peptidase (beta-lactamase class C family)
MVSEVVRRTDPKGRSFQAFVQDEILRPLAIDDLWMGVPSREHHRVAFLIDAPPRQLPPDAPPFLAIPLQVGTRQAIFGRKDVRESCIPGAGGFATARCMARFFAMLANGGALDGVRILPEALVKTFSIPRPDAEQPDDVHGVPLRIGAGFWLGGNLESANLGRIAGKNPRVIGHPGAGCSIAWADPDQRIAVSISHNRMCLPPATAQDPIRQVITEAFGAE